MFAGEAEACVQRRNHGQPAIHACDGGQRGGWAFGVDMRDLSVKVCGKWEHCRTDLAAS